MAPNTLWPCFIGGSRWVAASPKMRVQPRGLERVSRTAMVWGWQWRAAKKAGVLGLAEGFAQRKASAAAGALSEEGAVGRSGPGGAPIMGWRLIRGSVGAP